VPSGKRFMFQGFLSFNHSYLLSIQITLYVLEYLITFNFIFKIQSKGPSWPCSYGSWIYNYLCNQCLSPLTLWVPTHDEVNSIQHYVMKFMYMKTGPQARFTEPFPNFALNTLHFKTLHQYCVYSAEKNLSNQWAVIYFN